MESPLVDVCIPVYKPKAEHLGQALNSLMNQSFARWHAWIRDDSPETGVENILMPFASGGRIGFKRNAKRLGIGGNWNACLQAGNAPYVAFLFQDDVWKNDYLASALGILEKHSNVGFVSMEHEYSYEGDIPTRPRYEELKDFCNREIASGHHLGRNFLRRWIGYELYPNLIGEPSFVVMRRAACSAAGIFLKDMPQFLDVEYWTRLLQVTDWYFLRGNRGTFRVHADGTSALNHRSGQGLFDRLRCFENLTSSLNGQDRALTIQARNKALETMAAKFFKKFGSGSHFVAKGSGFLRLFCLKHPFLMTRIALKTFRNRRKSG
ncbi:hypothetical protein A3A67_02275 [Candidatus Peribacteria bacterium RIFCSPLOWO2_01_FULL_51_18]|nr:MAG: hypothetical protein A3A67_02275 [Candidatus Peribacteria bacterium RIFCSPLOWO2_01_FULL_51_18]